MTNLAPHMDGATIREVRRKQLVLDHRGYGYWAAFVAGTLADGRDFVMTVDEVLARLDHDSIHPLVREALKMTDGAASAAAPDRATAPTWLSRGAAGAVSWGDRYSMASRSTRPVSPGAEEPEDDGFVTVMPLEPKRTFRATLVGNPRLLFADRGSNGPS